MRPTEDIAVIPSLAALSTRLYERVTIRPLRTSSASFAVGRSYTLDMIAPITGCRAICVFTARHFSKTVSQDRMIVNKRRLRQRHDPANPPPCKGAFPASNSIDTRA